MLWTWEQSTNKLKVGRAFRTDIVGLGGTIQSYIVGPVCMHCLYIIAWGILGELTKLWNIVVDFNVFRYITRSGQDKCMIIHILIMFFVLRNYLDTLIFVVMIRKQWLTIYGFCGNVFIKMKNFIMVLGMLQW